MSERDCQYLRNTSGHPFTCMHPDTTKGWCYYYHSTNMKSMFDCPLFLERLQRAKELKNET